MGERLTRHHTPGLTCPQLGQTYSVRRHFFYRPRRDDDLFDAWDVGRLVELASALPVEEVSVSSISEIDEVYWVGADGAPPTVRIIVEHLRLVRDADLDYPILFSNEGRVLDGMHRVARALLEGVPKIRARRFVVDPPADHVAIKLGDVPHDEGD